MSLLLDTAARLAERVKVNALKRELRDGQPFLVKRRRRISAPVIAGANLFFRLAHSPVRALADPRDWQRWEVGCFQALHGGSFRAFALGSRSVAAEEMPGVCLATHLDGGTLTTAMAAAAGRELRRAHAIHCAAFAGAWSHGDPHTGNFLYDAAHDRARLIDFEVVHDHELSAMARHADDLLVFLQDVVGRINRKAWLTTARAFLEAYNCPPMAAHLEEQLHLPSRGVPALWWAIRANYLARDELESRLAALRASLVGEVTPASA